MAGKIDLSKVQTRQITSDLNKYKIKIEENDGLDGTTGFWWLRFTFDFALEKGIEVRLTNFKYGPKKPDWTMEIVKCAYLGITRTEEMDSFDMEDELVNESEFRRLNEGAGNKEKLRKYLEENILPLVVKKIKYTKYSPQFSFFLSHKSKDKPLMRTFRNGLKFLGYKTWLDEEDMPMGARLQAALKVAIDNCSCFVVWLNEEYFQSEYCQAELLYAKQEGKYIVPFGVYSEIKHHFKDEFKFLVDLNVYDTSNSSFFKVLRKIDEALFDFEMLPIY